MWELEREKGVQFMWVKGHVTVETREEKMLDDHAF